MERGMVLMLLLVVAACSPAPSPTPETHIIEGTLSLDYDRPLNPAEVRTGLCYPDAGCDGVWVSNHGGRQLDTAVTSAEALPEIAAAVGDRAVLVADGGVRRSIDVLKALALGADLVAVGRPILWGLAVDGADGVQRVLDILKEELSRSMALAGCRTIDEVTPDLIAQRA